MLPKPALKSTNSKSFLFYEALSKVKIGSSLYEPTCLFFPQEEPTPSEFHASEAYSFTTERKPGNPKKSQYCSIIKIRSPLVTTTKKREIKRQSKIDNISQLRLKIEDSHLSLTPTGRLVKPSTRFKEFNFASRPAR